MSLEKEFLEKIEKHKGVVFKISKMYMDDYDDQKDLFQEITFQAWKAFPNFRGESEFSTWLYRIALNTAIIFLKYEKKRSFLQKTETEYLKVETEDGNFFWTHQGEFTFGKGEKDLIKGKEVK